MEDNVPATDGQAKVVRIRRVAVSLLAVAGGVIGLAPAILLLLNPYWLLYAAGGGLLIAILYCVRERSESEQVARATNSPVFSEFLLAGLGGIFTFAMVGGLWIACYFALYWLLRASRYIIGWPPNPSLITSYVTGVLALLLAITCLFDSIQKIISQLYPNAAGINSAFYSVGSVRRKRLAKYFIAAILFLIMPTAFFLLLGRGIPIGLALYLQLALFFFSAGPYDAKAATATTSPAAAVAIGRLLESLGYQTTVYPRLGDEEVDPLLVYLDVIAYKTDRAIAIKLRQGNQSSEPVDWSAASGLLMCVRSLNTYLPRLELEASELEPCLVLLGVSPDSSLVEYSQAEPIDLVAISDETALHSAIGTQNQDEIMQMALEHFSFAVGEMNPSAPRKALTIPEGAG